MATETLRPNGIGSETSIATDVPTAGEHWDKVDEAVADDWTTYLQNPAGAGEDAGKRDLFALPAHSGSGDINKITVHIRVYGYQADDFGKVAMLTHATNYDGDAEKSHGAWGDFSKEWAQNPHESAAWTWDEIDALEIGVVLGSVAGGQSYCTQVYVVVDYTPVAVGRSFGFIIG